ncbi:MAG: endolytic transglycosylase MltG [Muribaculaceae bacterium]|nr:endolytic transglycosylase MltG [Muribaculaceae bacterium]MDE6321105.1 endolytic transglycosylase MltG [Muribaculaceae bacterium]
MKRTVNFILMGVVAVLIATFCLYRYVAKPYEGAAQWVYIPAGINEDGVRDVINSQLGPDMGSRVYRLWSMQGGTPSGSHGAYRIEPGTPAWRIARNIAKRMQTPVEITFSSVRTIDDMVGRITPNIEISSEQLRAAIDSILPARGYEIKEEQLAAFTPNTHQVYWDVSAERVVNMLLDDTKRFWNEQRQQKAEKLGLTPVQVVTLASIVEEETNKMDERPVVARLYLNRLDRGERLQSDPTVKYALGDPTLQRITDVSIDSPYNTYKYSGLPPGPLRIVESTTIDQVLNAAPHDYLFMCARSDGSGYHDFTASYKEHQRNARRYQAKLDSLGIK